MIKWVALLITSEVTTVINILLNTTFFLPLNAKDEPKIPRSSLSLMLLRIQQEYISNSIQGSVNQLCYQPEKEEILIHNSVMIGVVEGIAFSVQDVVRSKMV